MEYIIAIIVLLVLISEVERWLSRRRKRRPHTCLVSIKPGLRLVAYPAERVEYHIPLYKDVLLEALSAGPSIQRCEICGARYYVEPNRTDYVLDVSISPLEVR